MVRLGTRVCALALAVVAAACRHAPSERDRVLAQLPANAYLVATADGAALSAHAIRGALDAIGPYAPASWSCVLDAARAADAAGVAIGDDGVLVAIVARAPLAAPCAALSRYEPDLWLATIGGLAPAADRAASAAAAPRWARARDYLTSAPIALALADVSARAPRLIAVARTTPLELWLAIDGPPGPQLASLVESWRAAKLEIATTGDQIVVRSRGLGDGDLADLARRALATAVPPPPVAALAVACTPGGVVVGCRGRELVVRSVRAALGELAAASGDPIVAGGVVAGVRVQSDVLGGAVRAGDVVLGLDAHRVTSHAELAGLAPATAATRAALAVRRGDVIGTIDLRQQE